MALDNKDLEALRRLIREEIRSETESFKKEMAEFRSETQNNFDALFAWEEKREQETTFRDEQVKRIEERVGVIEKKFA